MVVPLGKVPLTTLPQQGLLMQSDAFPCLPQAFLSSERHMVSSSLLLLFITFYLFPEGVTKSQLLILLRCGEFALSAL